MNRIEFVETIRQLLEVEMPRDKVEENVRYYNDYIMSAGDEKRQVEEIERIGDPHLIAQTIIDGYKMSGQYRYGEQSQSTYKQSNEETEDLPERKDKDNLMQKVKKVCIIAGVVLALVLLIKFAFAIFLRIGLPIIGIYLIIRLIKDNMR